MYQSEIRRLRLQTHRSSAPALRRSLSFLRRSVSLPARHRFVRWPGLRQLLRAQRARRRARGDVGFSHRPGITATTATVLRAPFVEVILKPDEVGMLRLQRKPSTAAKRVGEVVGSGDAMVDGVLTAAVRAALEQTELAQKPRHIRNRNQTAIETAVDTRDRSRSWPTRRADT